MKMFSDCSGECCICSAGGGCLAGNGEDCFSPATTEQIIQRLKNGQYPKYKETMVRELQRRGVKLVDEKPIDRVPTDKDIIKALECCGNNVIYERCTECPYDNYSRAICTIKLTKDALDLINRQQGYIDGQKEELDYLRNIVKQKDMTIKICEGIINNKEAELDKHKKHLNRNIVFFGSRGCGKTLLQMNQIESTINKIKAEAIKEFAERYKATLDRRDDEDLCFWCEFTADAKADKIDNLVKEMVGED